MYVFEIKLCFLTKNRDSNEDDNIASTKAMFQRQVFLRQTLTVKAIFACSCNQTDSRRDSEYSQEYYPHLLFGRPVWRLASQLAERPPSDLRV